MGPQAYWSRESARSARLPGGAPFRWIRAAERETFGRGVGFHSSNDAGDYEMVPLPSSEIAFRAHGGPVPLQPWVDACKDINDFWKARREARERKREQRKREPPANVIRVLPVLERVEEPVASAVYIKGYDAHRIDGPEIDGRLYQCRRCGKWFDGGSFAICTK